MVVVVVVAQQFDSCEVVAIEVRPLDGLFLLSTDSEYDLSIPC